MNKFATVAGKVEQSLTSCGVALTLGGEPTYVPINPDGQEWSITALGPTKLRYAYALADALIAQSLPNAVTFFSPGKYYPGEGNPRWALNLVWNKNGKPLVPALGKEPRKTATSGTIDAFKTALLGSLKLKASWLRAVDPLIPRRTAWVLPLDHDGKRFRSDHWKIGKRIELLRTEGPAGLRLPLNLLPETVSKRALTIEIRDDQFHVFLPPLLQKPFLLLLEAIVRSLHRAAISHPVLFSGYIPEDETESWCKLGIAADPGVIEVNLPPCFTWSEYDTWMHRLETACGPAGLRSYKQTVDGDAFGTGGGNHILFGGPTLDTNPLFTHPRWVTSILRYWQHHPSLSYLFTGQYVGSSSQAPRPDESSSSLYDLEMAYQFLESLPPGDHRYLLSETIRHLHTDGGGNTHRSETSFDKFWNTAFEGGCRGLLEFRAIETFPHAEWMSAIALLWRALAAWLLARPFAMPLVTHGEKIHDYYFLPTCLWADFEIVLKDLKNGGFDLPVEAYRAIADWRFPEMLSFSAGPSTLSIRKALEDWPLLCETPLEGGSTSRFVDTSIERLEFIASRAFATNYEIRVQGRELHFDRVSHHRFGAGLRYRRTALYPSLHPGIRPQLPLILSIKGNAASHLFRLDADSRKFTPATEDSAPRNQRHACKTLHAGLLTRDLRLP